MPKRQEEVHGHYYRISKLLIDSWLIIANIRINDNKIVKYQFNWVDSTRYSCLFLRFIIFSISIFIFLAVEIGASFSFPFCKTVLLYLVALSKPNPLDLLLLLTSRYVTNLSGIFYLSCLFMGVALRYLIIEGWLAL